uniref:Consortin C-terminal domain-containing protein n=1 Tax=Neogobius melanostomus TaxID=47308 RepID=A0A8C6WZ62_9GOBI
MDHGGRSQFGMEDSIMSQEDDHCDSLAVSPENLNEVAQTQSRLASENENRGQQFPTTKASFKNNGNYEPEGQDKNICVRQMEEDQDEEMKEEEDYSEESSLIYCQSPDTPMTDSSYSETGSLLETTCGFSPGMSPEPASPIHLMEGPLDSCDTELTFAKSLSSSEHYTSSQETVLNHMRPPEIGPSAVSFDERELLSQRSVSLTAPTLAGIETSIEPTCTTEITMNQEPTELLGFLDQLAEKGDDTCLPQYLHQIAEAFVYHEDYQRAIWCLQLERLYHQRLLDNLSALQKQWETRCNKTSPALTAQHLDTLKHICLTHSRPKASDAVCASLDPMVVPSCSLAKGQMEQVKKEDCSGSFLSSPSIDQSDQMDSPEVTEGEWEDYKLERNDSFQPSQSNEKEGSECKVDETKGGLASTMLAEGDGIPPSVSNDMDQSKTAEQQVADPAQEKETNPEEERDVEEATEALDMEDDDEAEEEEHNGKAFCPETLPVETVVSAAAVEIRQQESKSEQKETQLSPEDVQGTGQSCLPSEMHPTEEYICPPSLEDVGIEEDEEDYEVEPAELIRASATLDTLAKLITVEEMVPAPGLVSILKKRSVCNESPIPASPEPQCNKLPAKRRVRFKVPDDGFDNEMGGGDSCLLLVLLCLVTVVISIGGTALYCALGDTHSSVCQDFSRNADFYISQIQRGVSQIQLWFTASS